MGDYILEFCPNVGWKVGIWTKINLQDMGSGAIETFLLLLQG